MVKTLAMRCVPCDQLQAVRDGYGRNHWVASADGSPDVVQVPGNLSRQVSSVLIEEKNSLRGDGVSEGLDTIQFSDFLQPLDHLHDGNDRNGQEAVRFPVSSGVPGNILAYGFQNFGVMVP